MVVGAGAVAGGEVATVEAGGGDTTVPGPMAAVPAVPDPPDEVGPGVGLVVIPLDGGTDVVTVGPPPVLPT